MSLRLSLFPLLIVALPALSNCGSSTTTPSTVSTTPTTTAAANVTESFSGTLNKNGGLSFPFLANGAGSVSAIVKSVSPDSTIPIGVSLGSWSGSACSWAVANDNALQGTAVTGSTTATTNLCVRIYDVGKIGDTPLTVAVDVSHP